MRPFPEDGGITTNVQLEGQTAGRTDGKCEEKSSSRSAGGRARVDAVAGVGLSRAGA
jgi:hypothetical protein